MAPVVPDLDFSFDAEPAYGEFSDGIGNTSYGCPNLTPPGEKYPRSKTLPRDATIRRHGPYSCRVTTFSDTWAAACDGRRGNFVHTGDEPGETVGSEAWYSLMLRIPADFKPVPQWCQPMDHNVHAFYWPCYGHVFFNLYGGSDPNLEIVFHTGLTPGPGSSSFGPEIDKSVPLLGPEGVRPFTQEKWHDLKYHVVWSPGRPGDPEPVFDIWHRQEGESGFTKVYSASHPTMIYNTKNGAPGENGLPGLRRQIGCYGGKGALPRNPVVYWVDGICNRKTEAEIDKVFPNVAPPAKVRKVAETPTTLTLEWDPIPGSAGYRFSSEKQTKPSHTWDPTRATVKFAKGSAWYRVEALDAAVIGEYKP